METYHDISLHSQQYSSHFDPLIVTGTVLTCSQDVENLPRSDVIAMPSAVLPTTVNPDAVTTRTVSSYRSVAAECSSVASNNMAFEFEALMHDMDRLSVQNMIVQWKKPDCLDC